MEKTAKTTIKNIRSHEFEEYLVMVDPRNGNELFLKVFLPIKSFYIFTISKIMLHLLSLLLSLSFSCNLFFPRLEGIGTSFQSLKYLLRSSRRLLLQMWSLSSKVDGYIGGTHLPWHKNPFAFPLVL